MREAQRIEELELKIRRLSSPVEQNANRAARKVVLALVAFLRNGGELPEGLILSVGAALVPHVANGEQMANDIQSLFQLLDKASATVSADDTVKFK